MLQRLFLAHPHSVGESYFQHQRTAFGFFGTLVLAATACLIHGLVPCLFKRTASGMITQLHDRMVTHRVRGTSPVNPPAKLAPRRAELSSVD